MKVSPDLLRYLRHAAEVRRSPCLLRPLHKPRSILFSRPNVRSFVQRRFAHEPARPTQPADSADFVSLVDQPPVLISARKKHSYGLIVLAIIPITAFALGTWQVQRLGWKTDLMARFEDRLVRDPLPLPPTIDPNVIHDFDYRRVYATGRLRHDQEMLIGPRLHDGENGYIVMTPLERAGGASKILCCRGWISKAKAEQKDRPLGLPTGKVTVAGLLREPFKKNMFTPDNNPEKGQWYFPDVKQMAEWTGSQPVMVEETMEPDLLLTYDREAKGIPIGRAAEVNLRNNHTQYIFTWYSLSLATTIMFWMVVKRPVSSIVSRVRRSQEW